MDFRGVIENGVIRPLDEVNLPDGTQVEWQPVNGVRPDAFEARAREAHARAQRHRTLEELAAEQAVGPVGDVRELIGDWPPEDDLDDFLRYLREIRR
jgi:predicted DNA-binding antitoxin AbrB/MazE fold protein